MGDTIVALAGTGAGEVLALVLALLSALAHAVFGAINKGGRDPYLNRGAINLFYGLIALPFALFVLPWPSAELWLLLIAVYFVHIVYEYFQARAYEIGGFTVVYPIARGTGPLITVVAAGFVFGERFGPVQWAGLLLLSGAIYGLAWANIRTLGYDDFHRARRLRAAILAALLTGVCIAGYTTIDGYGVRLAQNPFTFLAWMFVSGGAGFPLIAYARWRKLPAKDRPAVSDLAIRGLFGALIAFISFGAVMLAIRLDKVGEAVALRETSIIFAVIIGVLLFKETIDLKRLSLIGLIALGAVVIKLG